jgi:putative transcriptional regulator
MSIEHHPTDSMLAAFAAGTLDHGQHIAIATHLVTCSQCRAFTRSMEHVGGAVLSGLSPAAMSNDALAKVEAQLNKPVRPASLADAAPTVPENEVPGLPKFLRRYRFGSWKWIAPSVHLRPIILPYASDSRVFLLKSGPGTKMLEHTHTGIEMTCVLSGAFTQDGSHYGPGDFDLGDETIDHQPFVDPGQDCICLVAMQGELRLNGWIGRMVQPFVRL